MKKIFVTLIALLLVLAGFSITGASANEDNGRKVFVCKYVGKPGVDEELKDGKNPISVSSSATVGTYFNDAQGRSYVLMEDNTEPGPEDDPALSDCPAPDGEPEDPTEVTADYSLNSECINGAVITSVVAPETETYTVRQYTEYRFDVTEFQIRDGVNAVFALSDRYEVSDDRRTAFLSRIRLGTVIRCFDPTPTPEPEPTPNEPKSNDNSAPTEPVTRSEHVYTCDQKWTEFYEKRNGSWVKTGESERVSIDGHCDETGVVTAQEEGM